VQNLPRRKTNSASGWCCAKWREATEGKAMAGNGKRLKGSQLGYSGKGIPDADTLRALHVKYEDVVLESGLPPDALAKYNRMQELYAASRRLTDQDARDKALTEAAKFARELLPILSFRVDEVDWDN
jgi:hypothetical protein